MIPSTVPMVPCEAEADLEKLGRTVEACLGLVFSEKRSRDLWNALNVLAVRSGELPHALLSRMAEGELSDAAVATLAEHLTVGETYFFREPKTLHAFETVALPALLASKRKKRFRIWCAGCSTGEEPYTLSMILHRAMPDIRAWDVSILGTDINPRVLDKARRGIYSSWSFRGLDEALKRQFFDARNDGSFSVKPLFRDAVSFSSLNLANRQWRLWNDSDLPDVIFCRNVLIYFAAEHREEVVRRFHSLLPREGWLVVAPCETSVLLASNFSPVHHHGATLYRKDSETAPPAKIREDLPFASFFENSLLVASSEEERNDVFEVPWESELAAEYSFFEAEVPPLDPPEEELAPSTKSFLHNARVLADKGSYEEALQSLVKARELDGTDPKPLYFIALVRSEMGDEKEAASSLRSALFLDPNFVLAHYALGSLALKSGREGEAQRHLRNAEEILSSLPPEALLHEGEGLQAGELLQTVRRLRR